MKTRIATIIALAALLAAASIPVFGQTVSRTAYFLDGYDFKNQLNPAIPSARSYFSLPAIGNDNISLNSAFGINTLLYPTGNGNLTTFMNETVDPRTFLGTLKQNNRTDFDLSTSLLSIGAWGKKGRGFTTVDLGLRTNLNLSLPYSLFSFMKESIDREHYDIDNINLRSTTYLQLALGQSIKVTDKLWIGFKLKFLVGLADIKLNVNNLTADLTAERWRIAADGSLSLGSGGFIRFPTYSELGNEDGAADQIDITSPEFDFGQQIIGGYGGAVDLGFTYEAIDGLTVSASVLDLGLIHWNNSYLSVTRDNAWNFTGFEEISLDSEKPTYISTQLNSIFSDMKDLINLYDGGNGGAYNEMLACSVLVGAEYKMPFYKNLSAGFLFTSHIQSYYTWFEGRLSANLALGNCFSICASYALSTFGSSLGSALCLHCAGLEFHIGMDTIPLKYTTALKGLGIGLPLGKLNLNANFGLAFNVSKRRDGVDNCLRRNKSRTAEAIIEE